MNRIEVTAPAGAPEIRAGDDLAAVLLGLLDLDRGDLADGDVVVVTSKVVSKAEGRVRPGTREDALPGETARVVARRGPTTIVRNHLGLTMAAAGIDGSNVDAGHVVLLPLDPDGSARTLRASLRERTGHNVAVIVTDTAGRAWREGQTDIAIGAAGLVVAQEYAGRTDRWGNELAVTLPAVADEIAGAAELAQGKLDGRPFAVVRGRADLVLPPDVEGAEPPRSGAERADLFGYAPGRPWSGVARRARRPRSLRAPAPAGAGGVIRDTLGLLASRSGRDGEELLLTVPRGLVRAVAALAFAHGWDVAPTDAPSESRLRPAP